MTLLNLKDCRVANSFGVDDEHGERDAQYERNFNYTEAVSVRKALDYLQRQFETDEVKILSLRNSATTGNLKESPVWYRVVEIESNGEKSNEIIRFYTSHYIGNCTINDVTIKIRPRFGDKLFNHLLQYACNIYLPKGNVNYAEGYADNAYWLVGLLWKALLGRAITAGQIPKEYKTESKNLKTYKGHLNIQKHIKKNLVDQSKFFCTYRKLTMNNTINQTIRYTYSVLNEHGIGCALSDIASYDRKLESFGVSCLEIKPKDIEGIKYTKMNFVYSPVMEFSKAIISRHFAETKSHAPKQAEAAFFIDMAELWEMYLLRILQNNLNDDYSVYSPNLSASAFLLEDNSRSIRPDIIIEKNHRVVMIIDAKYKRYETLGKSAQDRFAVSREDLYQMTTYLYHYGKADKPIYGIFVSPANYKYENPRSLEHNSLHKIGLVNMEMDQAGDDLVILQQYEQSFVNRIMNILEK
jgi:5-methylcytosine-specific restriction endonuclease McrBC regulatory subunit McrC